MKMKLSSEERISIRFEFGRYENRACPGSLSNENMTWQPPPLHSVKCNGISIHCKRHDTVALDTLLDSLPLVHGPGRASDRKTKLLRAAAAEGWGKEITELDPQVQRVKTRRWVPLAEAGEWIQGHSTEAAGGSFDWDALARDVQQSYRGPIEKELERLEREKRKVADFLEGTDEPVRQVKRRRIAVVEQQ